jgi:riboflavin synthase
MFTGLVETLGTVCELLPAEAGRELRIEAATLAPELVLGESVAINGVCLTVVEVAGSTFRFQVGPETLQRTNLGQLQPGDRVNLERSLRLSDRLGGHLVQGHIDGIGTITQHIRSGEWLTVWFQCAPALALQMVTKGSVAVDGISLTVVDVTSDSFSVALIPHTLSVTTLGFKGPGATVNLETDLLAKYVARMLQAFPNVG